MVLTFSTNILARLGEAGIEDVLDIIGIAPPFTALPAKPSDNYRALQSADFPIVQP
jgi:hypothetical protein